jgi:hypothetical protein
LIKKPQDIYKLTAERLQLPPEYIKDVVEYVYARQKTGMHNLTHVVFSLTGLGRFILRPMKFWKRKVGLEKLLESFGERRDNRGITIRQEIKKRYDQMVTLEPEVDKLYQYRKQQMYGNKESGNSV